MSWPPSTLTAQQRGNANTIIAVGQHLGASSRDIQIALMTAMQESELINVNSGDRDSLGLFQQRAAWAPAQARMDPVQSATMFFRGGQQGQRGLLDFKNRDQMSLTAAAQAVQVSAYPDAYAKWSSLAQSAMGAAGPTTTGTSENSPPATGAPTTEGMGPAAPAGLGATAPAGVTLAMPVGAGVTVPAGAQSATTSNAQATVDANGNPAAITAADTAATTPGSSPIAPTTGLSRDSFDEMFPQAGATRMFTSQNSGTQRRVDIVNTAMSYLGTPYVWGGNGRQGVDCSGLVQQVYKAYGIDLPRISSDQINSGQRISMKELQPGDLIGYDNSPRNHGADHIQIYAGNGRVIEAPRPGLAVRVRALDAADYRAGMAVRLAQLG